MKLKVLELFGGIGACTKALKNIGIDVNVVDYVEIDKYAVKSYNAINNTNFESQDITKWNKNIDVDLICHGSPCTNISTQGKQAGADEGSGTASSLMYETIRIVRNLKPKYILWENVKNLLSTKHKHNFDNYIERLNWLGYNSYYKVLNAKDYGVPQNRERVYTVSIRKDVDKGNFEFPKSEELKIKLKDVLEENVDEKYYLSSDLTNSYVENENHKGNVIGKLMMDKWQDSMKRIYDTDKYSPTINTCQGGNLQPKIKITKENTLKHQVADKAIKMGIVEPNDVIDISYSNSRLKELKDGYITKQNNNNNTTMPTITTTPAKYGITIQDINQIRIRKITPLECWRLMTFDDEDFYKAKNSGVSNSQLYKQARKFNSC